MKMKAILPASLLFISILLLASSSVAAQVGEKEKKDKEAERQQQLEHKSYVLVEEIASGALSLKLPENRSFVLAATADLMWEHDEPRARNLFWDALNTLNLMNNLAGTKANNRASQKGEEGANSAKPSAKEKERVLGEYFAVYALRQELLRRVARRDPTLALDMLRSSRQLPVEPIYASFPVPDDRELEQQIASEAAARDPERALQLARESLAKGLSFQLLDLLFRLNQKSEEAGKKFAGDIIDKLRARNMALDPYGARIAVSLLQFSRPPREAPGEKMQLNRMRQLKLEQEQRRELVDLITNAALTGSANPNLLFALEDVMPEVEELVPERVALLRRKLTSFNQTLSKEQKVSQEYNSIFHSGTPEEMIKLAVRAGDDDREWMQQQAIVMAVTRGRADSLRDFVNTEIEDQSRRKGLLDALDAEQINLAVSKGDAEGLRKLLPKIRLKEERARAMAEIALVLEKKGNHDEALKLLDEAQTLIKTDLNSETQTNALLAVVTAYALVEPAKAFSIIERTIDSANDQIAKLLLLDKILKSGAIKKGEIRLQQSGMMPIDFAVFKYGKSVAALAKVDFDRTKAAADRFERNELRLMVRLLLAQALLRGDDQAAKNDAQ
jgi:hypothetical protein